MDSLAPPQPSQQLPSTWKRLFATWLDGTPLMLILAIGTLPYLANGVFHASWPVLIAGWSVTLLYHICFLYYFGATPGKMLYGLRVVSVNGSPDLGLRQTVTRVLVSNVAPAVCSILPQSFAFFRPDRRQLADLAAGTRVVMATARPAPPRRRPILGTLLVLFALIATANSVASYGRYHVSSDGVELDLLPRSR